MKHDPDFVRGKMISETQLEYSKEDNRIHDATMPSLSLEGTLIRDNNPIALISVNHAPAEWYYINAQIQPDLEIVLITNSGVLLRQNMAYYELSLTDRH